MSEETINETTNENSGDGAAIDIDTLEAIVDNLSEAAENNESASNEDEKAQAVNDLQGRIDALESQNAKMLSLIDKMVRTYGARFDSVKNGRGAEAFEPMKVEKLFEQPSELAEIPTLDSIELS